MNLFEICIKFIKLLYNHNSQSNQHLFIFERGSNDMKERPQYESSSRQKSTSGEKTITYWVFKRILFFFIFKELEVEVEILIKGKSLKNVQ